MNHNILRISSVVFTIKPNTRIGWLSTLLSLFWSLVSYGTYLGDQKGDHNFDNHPYRSCRA